MIGINLSHGREPRRRVIFFESYSGLETVVKIKKLRKGEREIRYRNKVFRLELDSVGFVKGRKMFYLVDLVDGQQVFSKNVLPITPEELDLFVARRTLSDVLLRLGHKPTETMTLLFLLAGIVCGMPLGMVLAPYLGV